MCGRLANTVQLQRLGDCIGKGAFGSVYKAFNWGTGEAVAVKQIKIADVPKSELRMIEVNYPPLLWHEHTQRWDSPPGPWTQRFLTCVGSYRLRSTFSRTFTMTTLSNTSALSSPRTASTSSSSKLDWHMEVGRGFCARAEAKGRGELGLEEGVGADC